MPRVSPPRGYPLQPKKSKTMRKIEVCCGSLHDVEEAFAGGAIRVELCGDLDVGGVTPPYEWIEEAVTRFPGRAVNVMVRPRGGDFVYSEKEVTSMLADIAFCKKAGVHGVVFGALTRDGNIDKRVMRRLMAAAPPQLSVTFHRAFDECAHPVEALEEIIALGCDRLLTSGQASTAPQGALLLAALVKQAAGRIVVMPGCGVRPGNIVPLERACGAVEYHSTSRGEEGHAHRDVVAQLVNA